MARSGCSSGWWIARSRRTFRCGTSQHAPMAPSAEPTLPSTGSAMSISAQVVQSSPAPATSIRATSSTTWPARLTARSAQAKMHDGGCAQGHARYRRGCARPRPRAGQYGGLPTITPQTQKGRDAICTHEAHPQARPTSTAGLKRRQGRGTAHRNSAEPAAPRQVPLRCSAISGCCLSDVVAADASLPQVLRESEQVAQRKTPEWTRRKIHPSSTTDSLQLRKYRPPIHDLT
jgi:hypothetical protein